MWGMVSKASKRGIAVGQLAGRTVHTEVDQEYIWILLKSLQPDPSFPYIFFQVEKYT